MRVGTGGCCLPDRVDEIVEHWPERCQSCAHVFVAGELVDAAEPGRHQVAELPPIAVSVTEHRLHAVRCPGCAVQTRVELPSEVEIGQRYLIFCVSRA